MKRLSKILFTALFLTQSAGATTTFYVAPAKRGNGTGTNSANAASYTNYSGFWVARVKPAILADDVIVYFRAGLGNYAATNLTLDAYGNASHRLYLTGETAGSGVWFNPGTMMTVNLFCLISCTNVEVRYINFTGDKVGEGSMELTYSRNIQVRDCEFSEMTNARIGGIGFGTAHDITIRDCLFYRFGTVDAWSHGIYARRNCSNLNILGNIFSDIAGCYIDLRNNINTVLISNNTFQSTATYPNEVNPVAICVFNNNWEPEQHEIFGNGYTIINNTFTFAPGSAKYMAVQWTHKGHPEPLETGGQIPVPSQIYDLTYGGPASKAAFLGEAGIDLTRVSFRGNTYNSGVTIRAGYGWRATNDLSGGSEADVSDAFYVTKFSHDWETAAETNNWTFYQNGSTRTVARTNTSAMHGIWSLKLYDNATDGYVNATYKPSIGSISRGYWKECVKIDKVGSAIPTAVPLFSNVGSTPGTIYWLKANADYKWGNNDGSFSDDSPLWTTNTWYFVEMVFNFDTGMYSIWVDNSRIGTFSIPTSNSAMTNGFGIQGPGTSNTGTLWVDYIRLGCYEPGAY